MQLSDVDDGRDNNLNLIRILAAFAVFVEHCFVLVSGSGDSSPGRLSLGIGIGELAVDVFFVISGFLVARSIATRDSIGEFARSRILRIFPALIVVVLLTVFVLGPAVSTLSTTAYLGSRDTWAYLVHCSTLLLNVRYTLPGVFADNPYSLTVNGPLWTLFYEAWLYAALAALWFAARPSRRGSARPITTTVVGLAIAFGAVYLVDQALHDGETAPFRLGFYFFTGASLYLLRSRVPLNRTLAAASAAMLVACALVDTGELCLRLAYAVGLPYLVMYLAFIPGGLVRRYNRLGDYSYGLYIYAFPIQQLVMHLRPETGELMLAVLAGPVALMLAIASWRFVEHPALQYKTRRRAPPLTRSRAS